MYYLLLYILVAGVVSVHVSSPCLAQSSTTTVGARGQAMGNATACLSDEWSMLNNVAGLADVAGLSAAVTYDAVPSLPAFGKAGMAISVPGTVASGLGVYRFGDERYNEQIICVGAATQWNHTSLGVKVNYIRYAAAGMGARGVFSVSLGGITKLTPWLKVGAHIVNVNQPWLSKQFDERLPTLLTVGLLFTLSPSAFFAAEVEKRINDKATGRAGLEFKVHQKVFARAGFQLNPQTISGGFGFHLRYFHADYGLAYNAVLGMRHQASLVLPLRGMRRSHDSPSPTQEP